MLEGTEGVTGDTRGQCPETHGVSWVERNVTDGGTHGKAGDSDKQEEFTGSVNCFYVSVTNTKASATLFTDHILFWLSIVIFLFSFY